MEVDGIGWHVPGKTLFVHFSQGAGSLTSCNAQQTHLAFLMNGLSTNFDWVGGELQKSIAIIDLRGGRYRHVVRDLEQ